ncbi:MAG: hypothetical protein J5U17_06410 [Candidatus Methanoperedens sp.]|nr:hypothetical protein [Candidatus Methanoperedens sp.]MCE8428351.1 hypothetical protein [Candidatus Methanoperedens sp.]
MKDILVSLLEKNRNNRFLKNKIELQCKCGHSEKITYYDILASGEFNIGKPIPIISPFISESIYDETINVSPLIFLKKCPDCGGEITSVFPVSLENLIPILQLQPPDPQMYG